MTEYDVIIIGSGPAGMTSALYASRAELSTLIIEQRMPGGQVATTDEIENYPGFKKTNGPELSMKMYEHMIEFGAAYESGIVTNLTIADGYKIVQLADKQLKAKAVILATGADYKMLGAPGEKEFRGMGVSYCATCDGAFYRGKEVVVVGGGDTAVEEAQFLTKFANKVTIIHRRDALRGNKKAQARILKNEKITVLYNTAVVEIEGNDTVESIRIRNVETGNEERFPCDGVFVLIGMNPVSELVAGLGVTDDEGYIITNTKMETAIDGLFAAGDIRQKQLRQVVTAVSDGAIAAISAGHWIEEELKNE